MAEKKDVSEVSRFKTDLATRSTLELERLLGKERLSPRLQVAFINLFQTLPNKTLEHLLGLLVGIEE